MADALEDMCRNPEMTINLEKMLNNKRYSDTIFLVNKRTFYASSHLVSVSSVELSNVLETHYENCGDREIRIEEVKHNESFTAILRFMYGLDIDLPQLNKAVLCEVLTLAERYEMKAFVSMLKSHLSKLECFQLDFLVVLLNTAKKFHMIDLYEKLTFYTYVNADQLVHHESFGELQYDVLLDLVKANFFYTDEIDILKGVLNWHGNNMSNNPSKEDDIEAVSDEETDEENDIQGKKKVVVQKTSNKRNSNNDNPLDQQSQSNVNTKELMKEFSTNVLKSLLSHVRFSQVSAVEIYKLMETELYTKYKEFLCDSKFFSQSSEPRMKYVAVQSIEKGIKDISKTFTVKCPNVGVLYDSVEEHIIGDLKWKICLKHSTTTISSGYINYTVEVGFKCSLSDELLKENEWDCRAEVQIKMIPSGNYPTLFIPGNRANTFVTLNSNNATAEVGSFFYNNAQWAYMTNTGTYKFEVNYKSIDSKVKVLE